MEDAPLHDRINALSHEEERLYAEASAGGGLSDDDRARLEEIRIALDQAYDLLHQRAGKRAAGGDPAEAEVRPPDVVENYEQ
jgi:hypothetical protein